MWTYGRLLQPPAVGRPLTVGRGWPRSRPAGERQRVRPGAARQQEAEREWRAQLSPPNGGPAPRPPLSAQAATLPEPGVGAEELGGSPAQNGAPLVTVTDAPAAGEGEGGWLQGASAAWEGLEARYKIIFATSMSFVICNMDKVNISVAIIPMAQDFGWSPTIAGLVQSSFFYGYLLSQVPGGYLVSRMGGRKVLPAGVSLWSVATAAVPVLAGTIPGLCLSRALVGLGEGVAPAAATDLAARSVQTSERSRAISFIFGGLHVGSLLGLILAPAVISHFGWPAVFYLFGGIGVAWSLWWERLMGSVALQDPALAANLVPQLAGGAQQQQVVAEASNGAAAGQQQDEVVPWRGFLRNRPLQALAYTHFCNNWFHYTFLSWLPTYFTDVLSLDLTHAAQVSILPPVAAIAVSAIAGPTADSLLAKGVPVAKVRKAAQCMAFLGPALCLIAASVVDDGPSNGPLLVGLIALSLGLASFSLAGLYCNHADLSPRYAPVLLGLTNTTGALPGILGVAFTGYLFDQTGSWSAALFAPSIFFFLTGSLVYVLHGRAELQDFAAGNEPFQIEADLRRWLPWGGAGEQQQEEQRLKDD